MASLAMNIALSVAGLFDQPLDVNNAHYRFNFAPNFPFTDGSGANQVHQIFTDTRTIAASGFDDLDLINSGGIADPFNISLNLTKVRAIIITADAANVNDVVVGGAATLTFVSAFGSATDKVKIKPGGLFVLVAPDVNGYAVNSGSTDLFRVANGGAGSSVNYTVLLVGS